jgi:murein DD-endopeptidase MepM/ murein hydrolase activator NlpD
MAAFSTHIRALARIVAGPRHTSSHRSWLNNARPFTTAFSAVSLSLTLVLLAAGCAVPSGSTSQQGASLERDRRGEEVSEAEVRIVYRENVRRPAPSDVRLPSRHEEVRELRDEERTTSEAYEGMRRSSVRELRRNPRRVSIARHGFVLPYPVTRENVIGTFGDCRPGGRTHAGLDLAGVGPNLGLGTPIYSMARARVTFIGLPQLEPAKYGSPDKRRGTTERGPHDQELPRSEDVAPYGPVFYFTRDYGSWRSGVIIYTEVLEGPLAGHTIRYMHLGAIHPELERGDILEAGQELGLMGGTAVMEDSPHVHIDIEDEEGNRVDVAPFLGLPPDPTRCER